MVRSGPLLEFDVRCEREAVVTSSHRGHEAQSEARGRVSDKIDLLDNALH